MSQPMSTQVETLYRAKKIDSDEWVEGDYKTDDYERASVIDERHIVDKSTLAIHFTNSGMEDSEGTPIFASLSSDGNGGDKLHVHQFTLELAQNLGVSEGEKEFNAIATFRKEGLCLTTDGKWHEPYYAYSGLHEESFKVKGIYTTDKE